MVRRPLPSILATLLLSAHCAPAQKWMGRYIQERRAAEEGASRGGVLETGTSAGTEIGIQEIRRAMPVEAAPSPATPPAQPFFPPEELPVRRAQPVAPSPPPAPAPEPVKPEEHPSLRVAPPPQRAAPEPAEDSPPVLPAQPTQPASAELDPGAQQEIRLSPGASVPADVAQFNYANGLYARKDYERAAPEFERYLSLYQGGADRQAAFFRLAECYRQLGSLNAARKNYEALIYTFQMGDFIGPASYRLAELCYQEKDYSSAVAFFRKASVWVKDPAIVLSAKFYAARSLEGLKFTGDAIQAYEDVLATRENNPFREAAQLALVQLLDGAGRRRQALLLLETLRKETDKPAVKAEATTRLGLIYLDQKQNDKAATELAAALKMPELGAWSGVASVGLLRALYAQGKYQPALDAYRAQEAGFSPEALPEVLLIAGNCERQLGRVEKAQAFYDRIAREFPDSPYVPEAQYQRLVGLYTRNSADLVTEIDTYLATHPEAGEKRDQLTLMKAESYYKVRQYAAAAPLYAALEKSTLPPALQSEALFKLGWCCAQTGDYSRAADTFSAFLARFPVHKLAPTALAQKAYSHERLKDYKSALSEFNELLERYPKAKEREFALQRKALILGQLDETRGMVETFTRLLKEYPKSQAAGQAQYWIGMAAFQARNYKEAIAPLTAARSLDKDYAEKATALLLAARLYLEDRDGLASEIDQADEKTKIPAEALRWLGAEYLKSQDAARAERYLSRLTALPEGESMASDWLNLGQAQGHLGKWAEAETAIQTYLKAQTEPIPQASGYLALGQAQLGAKKYEAAQESARKVVELQPEGRLNAQGRILSADIAFAQKDYEAAAKLYQSTALVFEDPALTPKALEQACVAYRQAGNPKLAAKLLNELQSRYPEYPVTASARP